MDRLAVPADGCVGATALHFAVASGALVGVLGTIGEWGWSHVWMPIAWPAHFVFGNCDSEHEKFARQIARAGQTCHGTFGDLEFEGVRVAR